MSSSLKNQLFPAHLPEPSKEAKEHSLQLYQLILQAIKDNKGWISFYDFMNYCLYQPGLGYYSAGSHKIGALGDFTTGPEYTNLFGKTLAHYIQQSLINKNNAIILELGAGTGKLAGDILLELEAQKQLPVAYWILEISADLAERQKEYLKKYIPHLFSRLSWLTSLPNQFFEGIIVANEVLDALPVQRFQIQDGLCYEIGVSYENNQLIESIRPAPPDLKAYCKQYVLPYIQNAGFYQSEACLLLPEWLKSMMHLLTQGELLFLDYGYEADIYYHPQRVNGTLMCHYRHRAHSNPYQLIGLQDITPHVNFSHVIDSAIALNGTIQFYENQAAFLLNEGILQLYEQAAPFYDIQTQIKQNQALKKLLFPQEMGEIFKVISILKGN